MTKADAAEIGGDGYRLDVENFGPIVRASVDVRPLTVFVGPSNTGKSYLAILLYALHQCFGGPSARRWPLSHWRFGRPEALAAQPDASIRQSLRDWLSKGAGEKSPPAPRGRPPRRSGAASGGQSERRRRSARFPER